MLKKIVSRIECLQLMIANVKRGALLLSLIITFSGQTTAHAKTIDVNALTPIINLILEQEDNIQCPSLDEITGGNLDVSDFTVGSVGVFNSGDNIFDASDLGEFLRGASGPGAGTAAEDLVNAGNELGSSNQLFGRIEIFDQDGVNELEGIIQIVGELVFSTSLLTDELDLSPLNSLVEVTGQVSLTTSNATIGGFQCLSSVGGDLNIQNNQNLTSIDGFQSLESIGLSLSIQNNASLDGLGSLASLSRSDVNENIIITNNTSFDCANPAPEFVAATSSTGNTVNCSEDLNFRTITEAITININESTAIPDLGSVSSTTTAPALLGLSGLVSSLVVNLDITHTSVGDLTVTLSNGTTTINLLARPTNLFSNDVVLTGIANACIDNPFVENDFLTVELGSTDFASFPSVDAECATGMLRALAEDGDNLERCNSNNISVSLFDDTSLPPINTSCSIDDLGEAFFLPSYLSFESLSAFEGSSVNNTWTLTVTDSESGNVGMLNSWGLVFNLDR